MVQYTVKYTDNLAHAHYHPCNEYQAVFSSPSRSMIIGKNGLDTRLALHKLAVNGAAGVTSYKSALPRFVRFSEKLQSSSRARSRIHSSRRHPLNLWDRRVVWSGYCATTTFGIKLNTSVNIEETERWSETVKIVGSPAPNSYRCVDRTCYNS